MALQVAPGPAWLPMLARRRHRSDPHAPRHESPLPGDPGAGPFLHELKSFEQDTLLDRIDPGVRTFSVGIMSLQKRANRLGWDAGEQLLPYAIPVSP